MLLALELALARLGAALSGEVLSDLFSLLDPPLNFLLLSLLLDFLPHLADGTLKSPACAPGAQLLKVVTTAVEVLALFASSTALVVIVAAAAPLDFLPHELLAAPQEVLLLDLLLARLLLSLATLASTAALVGLLVDNHCGSDG
ncbi:hypothetical protein, partial [Brucella melitensis]|uniref:hypothetical protein n=1 Tax=Brucella melitensis TaxID=29459 RepID=UPI0028CEA6DC